jgi:hypothetical protein
MATQVYVDNFGYTTASTTTTTPVIYTTTYTNASTTSFDITQEKPMTDGVVVDNYPDKINLRAVETIDGWVGQICCGEEVIWQSKKGRRDKKDKYDNTIEGSYRALVDARKHRRSMTKKQYRA